MANEIYDLIVATYFNPETDKEDMYEYHNTSLETVKRDLLDKGIEYIHIQIYHPIESELKL